MATREEIERATRRQLGDAEPLDYWGSPCYEDDRLLCARVALEAATYDSEGDFCLSHMNADGCSEAPPHEWLDLIPRPTGKCP